MRCSLIKNNQETRPGQVCKCYHFNVNWIIVTVFYSPSFQKAGKTPQLSQTDSYLKATRTLPPQSPTSFVKAQQLPINLRGSDAMQVPASLTFTWKSTWKCRSDAQTQCNILLPESESFWSPFAPAVKGSFLLGAFSFISLTPSLRSNLGVLFVNTLSCKRDKINY